MPKTLKLPAMSGVLIPSIHMTSAAGALKDLANLTRLTVKSHITEALSHFLAGVSLRRANLYK